MESKNYFGRAPIVLGVIGLICSCATSDFSRSFNNFMQPEKNLIEFMHEEMNKPIVSADFSLKYDFTSRGGLYRTISGHNYDVDLKDYLDYEYIEPFNRSDSIDINFVGDVDRSYYSAVELYGNTNKTNNSKYSLALKNTADPYLDNFIILNGTDYYRKDYEIEKWSKGNSYDYSSLNESTINIMNAIEALSSIPQDIEIYLRALAFLDFDFAYPTGFYKTFSMMADSYSKVAFQLACKYLDLVENYDTPFGFTNYLCSRIFFLNSNEYNLCQNEISKRIFRLKNESNISLFNLDYSTKGNTINVSLKLAKETYKKLYSNLSLAINDVFKIIKSKNINLGTYEDTYSKVLNTLPKNFSCTRTAKVVDLNYCDYNVYFDFSEANLLCWNYYYTNDEGGGYYVPVLCNEMNQHINFKTSFGGTNKDKVIVPTPEEIL